MKNIIEGYIRVLLWIGSLFCVLASPLFYIETMGLSFWVVGIICVIQMSLWIVFAAFLQS